MPVPDEFFLASENMSDDFRFLAPMRPGTTVKPLIDGADTFRAMEQAIAGATKSVYFAAWVFGSETTPLLSLSARKEVNRILSQRGVRGRVSNWGELFAAVAEIGVEVRILLTDFDPILQNPLHENAWRIYRLLRSEAKKRANGRVQIMCSLHDATIGLGAGDVQEGPLSLIINRLNRVDIKNEPERVRKMPASLKSFNDMPGLWPFLTFNKTTNRFAQVASPPWRIRPASHHQKICTIDNSLGFCGGLDVSKGRLDTKQHKKAWHDTQCQVDGPVAADLNRNFIGRWNREMRAFNTFISTVGRPTRRLPADSVTVLTAPSSSPPAGSGPAVAQLARTLSTETPFGSVPNNVRGDIRNVYRRAIGLAESFIYIENQYVRDSRLADWLTARARAVPSLAVILVLPVAPEEVSTRGGADPVTLKGLFLQHGVLARLKAEIGSRIGLYSMVKQEVAPRRLATDWAGSRQIYVHSKTMIVDDVWATIGSANTNPRSFEVDTEANIHWHDPASAKKLRLDLWREMLGSPQDIETWSPGQFINKWNAVANLNSTVRPKMRRGFIVPHDPENPAVQGRDNSLIPKEFAELVDIEAENDYLA